MSDFAISRLSNEAKCTLTVWLYRKLDLVALALPSPIRKGLLAPPEPKLSVLMSLVQLVSAS